MAHVCIPLAPFCARYFNKRGRAERIRLLLTLAAEPFRDQVVSGKQWGSYKKELALGTLPALFDDATCEETGQSMAIMRMMARKKGAWLCVCVVRWLVPPWYTRVTACCVPSDLYGSTARQQTVADIVADTVEDYRSKAARALFGPRGPDSEALMRYFEQDWPKLAAILTKFQRGAGGYFVEAGKPTYADVCVWDLFDAILQVREVPAGWLLSAVEWRQTTTHTSHAVCVTPCSFDRRRWQTTAA